MERRLLLVFALTFLVIILFQPLLKKYLPQPATQRPRLRRRPSLPLSQPAPAPRGAPGRSARHRRQQAGFGRS